LRISISVRAQKTDYQSRDFQVIQITILWCVWKINLSPLNMSVWKTRKMRQVNQVAKQKA